MRRMGTKQSWLGLNSYFKKYVLIALLVPRYTHNSHKHSTLMYLSHTDSLHVLTTGFQMTNKKQTDMININLASTSYHNKNAKPKVNTTRECHFEWITR